MWYKKENLKQKKKKKIYMDILETHISMQIIFVRLVDHIFLKASSKLLPVGIVCSVNTSAKVFT